MNPQQTISALIGKAILFIGTECDNWTPAQFAGAAVRARQNGYDTIAPRRQNGTIRLYRTPANLIAEYNAVHAQGVGYLPWGYHYGPRFGPDFILSEAAILQEMIDAIGQCRKGERLAPGQGFAMADWEQEFDNPATATPAARKFAAFMNGKPGYLLMTTWANPAAHNWQSVINALLPVVNGWVPQEYDNFLATASKLNMINIMPALDFTGEFGPDNPSQIIATAKAQGNRNFFFWEYQFLNSHASQARALALQAKG